MSGRRRWALCGLGIGGRACALSVLAALVGAAPALGAGIAPPDQAGRYKVGFSTFASTVGNGLPTKITVWYPHCAAAEIGCSSPAAGTPTYPLTILTAPNPLVIIPSPLGAGENVAVESNAFPFIVDLHGGAASAPFRERARLGHVEKMEHLASHGFIVASFERNGAAGCASEFAGPRDVISTMLERSDTSGDLFEGRIDAGKIGAMGTSAGGDAAYSLLTGANASASLPQGVAPDARVKALLVTEAAHSGCGISVARKQSVTRPYMVMGGSPDAYERLARQPFSEMVNANPRILVKTTTKADNPNLNAEHIGFNAGDCGITDALREGSLRLQSTSGQDPLIEPLTSTFGSDPRILDAGARVLAAETRRLWNNATLPHLRQKTICNRVGTNPTGILPIAVASSEGLVTSTPPFEPSPLVSANPPLGNPPFTACSPVRCITGDRTARLVKLFATAFWQTYLRGDRQYNLCLTQGYSNQEPDTIITRIGDDT